MSDLPEIDSQESFKAWLEIRPRKNMLLVAHRAAMRVAPIWLSAIDESWPGPNNLSAIPILYSNLVLGVACIYQIPERIFASASASASAFIASVVQGDAASAATFAAESSNLAASAATSSADTSFDFAAAVDTSAYAFGRALASVGVGYVVWDQIQTDVHALHEDNDHSTPPIWLDENPLVAKWEQSKLVLRTTPGGEFWIDWYQRALDGRPQNWPLLRDVALIDDALWKEGGEGLGREINRIAERHRLLEEVRRLKAELAEAQIAQAVIPHRGHNRPPELLPECPVEMRAAADEIANGLDEAEEELKLARPSPSRLKQIAAKIRQAVAPTTTYTAGLGDDFLHSAAKEAGATVGKWVGRSVFAYLILNSSAFERLADALINLAKLL